MCKQIREKGWNLTQIPSTKINPKSQWQSTLVDHPGQNVQIDIKYVPRQCILWNSYGKRYYQITSIDEYSRKRVCQLVDEKSVTHTATFLLDLEERFGFKIETIQTDNGIEFTNHGLSIDILSVFEEVLSSIGIEHKRTRSYSPWQNGIVERSHREDGKRFYQRTFIPKRNFSLLINGM